MKINDFIENTLIQIQSGYLSAVTKCGDVRMSPIKVSFSIKVNESGEVCGPADYVASTINVEI